MIDTKRQQRICFSKPLDRGGGHGDWGRLPSAGGKSCPQGPVLGLNQGLNRADCAHHRIPSGHLRMNAAEKDGPCA